MTLTTYSFALPTRIEFGPGISRTAAAEAKAMGATKVLLVADTGVLNAGLTLALWAGNLPKKKALTLSLLLAVVVPWILPRLSAYC